MTRHDAGEWLTAAADAHREAKQRERHSAQFLVATIGPRGMMVCPCAQSPGMWACRTSASHNC